MTWAKLARIGDALRIGLGAIEGDDTQDPFDSPSSDIVSFVLLRDWQTRIGGSFHEPKLESFSELFASIRTVLASGDVPPELERLLVAIPTWSGAPSARSDEWSDHPLLELASLESSPFFAQPVAPIPDVEVEAISPMLPFGVALSGRSSEELVEKAQQSARRLSREARRKIVQKFGMRPVDAKDAPDRRLVVRGLTLPGAPPNWMGRSYELAPERAPLMLADAPGRSASHAFTDSAVKGAGRTTPIADRTGPEWDGAMDEEEAYRELHLGEELLSRGIRSSIGAYVLKDPSRSSRGSTGARICVRFFRQARRISDLAGMDLVRRWFVVERAILELEAAGELPAGSGIADYLCWFADVMADNAARLACSRILCTALHPQNVTLAAEVVDHGGNDFLGLRGEEELLGAHNVFRPMESFANQPGRLLMNVRFLARLSVILCPQLAELDLGARFSSQFALRLKEPGFGIPPSSIPAERFQLLDEPGWTLEIGT